MNGWMDGRYQQRVAGPDGIPPGGDVAVDEHQGIPGVHQLGSRVAGQRRWPGGRSGLRLHPPQRSLGRRELLLQRGQARRGL